MFFSLRIWTNFHWIIFYKIYWIRLISSEWEGLMSISLMDCITSMVSVWINTLSHFLFWRIINPSRIPHNSTLNIEHHPNLLLNPRIHWPWWSFNIPLVVTSSESNLTAPLIYNWNQLPVIEDDAPILINFRAKIS